MNKFIEQLKRMNACSSAIEWIEARGIDTVQEFWKISDRGDWMMWLLYWEYPGIEVPILTIQDLTIEFAEMALPYAGEHKQVCIDCIYTTWQYLKGYASKDELIKKRKDTADYANIYTDTAAYAVVAAYACASSSFVNVTAFAAAFAADAVTDAADGDIKIRKQQANIIRRYIPEV